jgi:heme-binding protein
MPIKIRPPPRRTAVQPISKACGPGCRAATSSYLFTHPDVNDFYTSLEGLPRDKVSAKVKDYLANHPDVKADMTGIRQPLVDIRDRCGAPPSP